MEEEVVVEARCLVAMGLPENKVADCRLVLGAEEVAEAAHLESQLQRVDALYQEEVVV